LTLSDEYAAEEADKIRNKVMRKLATADVKAIIRTVAGFLKNKRNSPVMKGNKNIISNIIVSDD
jgi:hypothetical protein